jgi:hypothetical protein
VGRSGVLSQLGTCDIFRSLVGPSPIDDGDDDDSAAAARPVCARAGGRAWMSRESASGRNKPPLRTNTLQQWATGLTRRIEGPPLDRGILGGRWSSGCPFARA